MSVRKKLFLGLLAALLALSLVFVGCDNGSTSNGNDGGSETTPPAGNVDRMTYSGKDTTGKDVEVIISRTTSRNFSPAKGDTYVINYAGPKVSEGNIDVEVNVITFYPSGGGAAFKGELVNNYMSIPSIPRSGGDPIKGFMMAAGVGTSPGGTSGSSIGFKIDTTVSGSITTGLKFTFEHPVNLTKNDIFIAPGSIGSFSLTNAILTPSSDKVYDLTGMTSLVPGMANIRVNKAGVDTSSKMVEIITAGGIITTISQVGGSSNSANTTALTITYSSGGGGNINGLAASDIVFIDSAAVTKGTLVDNSPTVKILNITPNIQGKTKVYINKKGFDPTIQEVDIFMAIPYLTASGSPSSTVGVAFPVTLTANNPGGGTNTSYSGAKIVSLTGSGAPDGTMATVNGTTVLSNTGTFSVTFTSGVATIQLTVHKADTQTLTFSEPGLAGSASLSIPSPAPGPAESIKFTREIVVAAKIGGAGSMTITTQPQVTLYDKYGNVCSNDSSTSVTLALNQAGAVNATLGGNTATSAGGIANFTTTITTGAAGTSTHSLVASTGTLSATSATFTIEVTD